MKKVVNLMVEIMANSLDRYLNVIPILITALLMFLVGRFSSVCSNSQIVTFWEDTPLTLQSQDIS